MAIGDRDDMKRRIRRYLPKGWFPDDAPILDAVLSMPADALAYVWSQIVDAKVQSRISTATGIWLDLAARDFLGTRIMRGKGQSDDAFRTRVKAEILRERVTKVGMERMLTDLTGTAPKIFELWDANYSGGLDAGFYLDYSPLGEPSLHNQCLIDVQRQPTVGEAWVGGLSAEYDSPVEMFPAKELDSTATPTKWRVYPAFGCLTGDAVSYGWLHETSYAGGADTKRVLSIPGLSGNSLISDIGVMSPTISFRIAFVRNSPDVYVTDIGTTMPLLTKGTWLADSGVVTLPTTSTINDLVSALNSAAAGMCTVSTTYPAGTGASDSKLVFDMSAWVGANDPGDWTVAYAIGCSLDGLFGSMLQAFFGLNTAWNFYDGGLGYDVNTFPNTVTTSRYDGTSLTSSTVPQSGLTLGAIPDGAGSGLSDSDIFDAIEHTRPTGTVAWTALQ